MFVLKDAEQVEEIDRIAQKGGMNAHDLWQVRDKWAVHPQNVKCGTLHL